MAQDNPFDQFDGPMQGQIIRKPADPKTPFEVQRLQQQIGQGANTAAASAYDPEQARLTAAKTGQAVADRPFERGDKLRDDFNALPAVKEYRTALPSLMAGLKTSPDATGDNALIYAYAKAMDPGSVVRESEMGMASSTGSWLESAAANLKKQLGIEGGGQLSPAVREHLRREMNSKVAQLAKSYGTARGDFQQMAKRQNVNPEDVVGRSPAEPYIKDYGRLMGERLKSEAPAMAISAGAGEQKIDPTGGNPLLSEGDRDYLSRNARAKGPEWVRSYLKERNLQMPESEIKAAYDYWSKGGQQDPVVNVPQGDGNIAGAAVATPAGTAAASYLNSASFGVPQLLTGDKPFDAMAAQNPKATIAGDILGGITGTLGGAAGLVKAGMPIPRSALAANLGYGAIYGANTSEDNRLAGGAVGMGGSLVGEGLGRYAIAPAIDVAARSGIGKKALGMFGKSTPRRLSKVEGELATDILPNIEDVRVNLTDAQRLGLPMSLADASPTARTTLGAATRLDPVMAENIGKQLSDRNLGRNDRALKALSGMAEPVDMRATKDEIFKAAQDAATPFYERAYAQPAIVTPEVSGLLQRPSLREAMGKARGTIAEQGGSPTTMGFGLDAANNPILNPVPTGQLAEMGAAHSALAEAQAALAKGNASLAGNVDRRALQANVEAAQARLEAAQAGLANAPAADSLAQTPAYDWKALDYTKRGLDDVLEGMRDPVTRRLPSDRNTQAIQNTRVDYRNALGRLNDDYKQGLDAYSGIARRNDDLNAGFSGADPSTNLSDFAKSLGQVVPDNKEFFQRGYTTNLAEQIGRRRDGINAYDLVAGSPDSRSKLGQLFPQAPDFMRQRELEKGMTATGQEVLGGSQTAGRTAANDRFLSPDMGTLAEMGLAAATGTPPVGTIARGAETAARGMFGNRSKMKTVESARQIAPMLAEPNPGAAASSLDKLLSDMEKLNAYQARLRAGSALLTAPALGTTGANYF
jgi:hypothetical protein